MIGGVRACGLSIPEFGQNLNFAVPVNEVASLDSNNRPHYVVDVANSTDNAIRNRAFKAQGTTNRDHVITDMNLVYIPEREKREILTIDFDDCQISF